MRELRNVIDRALALSPGARSFAALRLGLDGVVGAEAPPVAVATELPWHEAKALALHGFEAEYLRALHAATEGNLSAAARKGRGRSEAPARAVSSARAQGDGGDGATDATTAVMLSRDPWA